MSRVDRHQSPHPVNAGNTKRKSELPGIPVAQLRAGWCIVKVGGMLTIRVSIAHPQGHTFTPAAKVFLSLRLPVS